MVTTSYVTTLKSRTQPAKLTVKTAVSPVAMISNMQDPTKAPLTPAPSQAACACMVMDAHCQEEHKD